jgi:hypothetical protein
MKESTWANRTQTEKGKKEICEEKLLTIEIFQRRST